MPKRSNWPPARWGVEALLDRFAGLAVRPTNAAGEFVIAGDLEFNATGPEGEHPLFESFRVEIRVPRGFPAEVPAVLETGGRVPRAFHTQPDLTLCLGSPLRLRMKLQARPNVLGFVESCLVPYLYGFARHERGEPLPYGELDHGIPGLLDEYRHLLRARDNRTCLALLALLGVPRRTANKQPCPCGSGRRVGRCHHHALNRLRKVASKSWFRDHAAALSG